VSSGPAWSTCGLGTASFGSSRDGPLWLGEQDRSLSVATVHTALDDGVTWLDTAPFYGWGAAEEVVGEAVRGRRDEVRILTKCGTMRRPDGTWVEDGSPAAVRSDVEASLRRLGVEQVDVVQLHDPDPATPIEDTVGALAALVDEGLVGAIGLSNHSASLMDRAATVAPIAVVQHQWNLLSRTDEASGASQWAVAHGAEFLAWSPLASGFLTSGFDVAELADDDLRRRLRWAQPEGAPRVARLREAAASVGAPLEELALAWAARTARPIVGARTPAEAAAMAHLAPLDDRTAALLERAAA
jgi:aryl-alcohol dehydrogenase-like predicted oxidoreductase